MSHHEPANLLHAYQKKFLDVTSKLVADKRIDGEMELSAFLAGLPASYAGVMTKFLDDDQKLYGDLHLRHEGGVDYFVNWLLKEGAEGHVRVTISEARPPVSQVGFEAERGSVAVLHETGSSPCLLKASCSPAVNIEKERASRLIETRQHNLQKLDEFVAKAQTSFRKHASHIYKFLPEYSKRLLAFTTQLRQNHIIDAQEEFDAFQQGLPLSLQSVVNRIAKEKGLDRRSRKGELEVPQEGVSGVVEWIMRGHLSTATDRDAEQPVKPRASMRFQRLARETLPPPFLKCKHVASSPLGLPDTVRPALLKTSSSKSRTKWHRDRRQMLESAFRKSWKVKKARAEATANAEAEEAESARAQQLRAIAKLNILSKMVNEPRSSLQKITQDILANMDVDALDTPGPTSFTTLAIVNPEHGKYPVATVARRQARLAVVPYQRTTPK